MTVHAICPDCGCQLPPDSPEGLCVKCLYEAAVRDRYDRHLHARCPHCHFAVEIVDDSPLSELTCPSCDTHFSLVGDQTETCTPDTPTTVGHFELIDRIGMGAFGTVWKALDRELDRCVAIKIPRKGQLSRVETEQFLREARAAAQLRHPSIVSVHEIGREQETIYIVSDFVDGVSLADWLTEQRLTFRESSELCQRIAAALHHAHENGVVHRDLKPSNIMLSGNLEPHIMDFGLAKREAGEITMTIDGKVLGTPAYMSPEQARGEAHVAGRRSDVYSLGVVMFELLTGEQPFRGSVRMLLHQVINDEPPSPRKLNVSVPRDLETICLKCLEKEPGRRYPTAEAVADDLAHWLNREPITARPISSVQRSWRWCRRKPVVALLSATAVLLLATIAVISTLSYAREAALRSIADGALRKESEARAAAESALASESAARQRAQTAGRQLQKQLADNYLYRGRQSVESGDVGIGMHWFVRALNTLPEGERSLDRVIRLNLDAAQQRLHKLERQTEHDDVVTAVSCSPDGRVFVTGSGDRGPKYNHGACRVWNTDTGQPIGPKISHEHSVLAVAFSPDGSTFATATGEFHSRTAGVVQRWETATGKPVGDPLVHNQSVWSVDFSPDGRTLLTGSGSYSYSQDNRGEVGLWNLETGRPVGGKIDLPYPVYSAVFSPDGTMILTAGGRQSVGEALLWDISAGKPGLWSIFRTQPFATRNSAAVPMRHGKRIMAARFSADGSRIVTAAYDNTARLWNAADGRPVGDPIGHPSVLLAAGFDPSDDRFVTACDDGFVRLWDVQTRSLVGQPMPHRDGAGAVACHPDGSRILTGSDDHIARTWRIAGSRSARPNIPFQAHTHGHKATYSPDGRLILAGNSLYDARQGQRLRMMDNGRDIVDAIAFRNDGRIALAALGATVRCWDISTGLMLSEPVFQHRNRIRSIAVSPDDRYVLTASRDRTVKLWDTRNGRRIGDPLEHDSQAHAAAFSPDGRHFVTAAESGEILVFETQTRERVGDSMRHDDTIWSVAFSPNGRTFATASEDQSVRFWDLESSRPVLQPLRHDSLVTCLDWSPDGSLLLTGCQDGNVQFWEVETGRPLGSSLRHAGPVISVMFAPDGNTALSTGKYENRSIRQWKVPRVADGDRKQITLWTKLVSGTELSDGDTLRVLTVNDFDQLQRQLQSLADFRPPADDRLQVQTVPQAEDTRMISADDLLVSGETQHAVEVGRQVVRSRRERFADQPAAIADALNGLANALRAHGEHQEADRNFAEALRLWGWPRNPSSFSPPGGPFVHLDLDHYVTKRREESTGRKGNHLLHLPRGTQFFEGVSYQFSRGVIQLGGQYLNSKPFRVDGIAVNSRAKAVYFLHSAQWGFTDGVEIADYEVHYEDATMETIPVHCGRDVRDWWWKRRSSPGKLHIAWVGHNDAVNQFNKLQISRSVWSNPHPEKTIDSLSFVCRNPQNPPACFCVAITVEQPAAELPAPLSAEQDPVNGGDTQSASENESPVSPTSELE